MARKKRMHSSLVTYYHKVTGGFNFILLDRFSKLPLLSICCFTGSRAWRNVFYKLFFYYSKIQDINFCHFSHFKCITILSEKFSDINYNHNGVQLLPLFLNFFHFPQTETLFPWSSNYPSPSPPNPWVALVYFLSLWICLLWIFCVRGLTAIFFPLYLIYFM